MVAPTSNPNNINISATLDLSRYTANVQRYISGMSNMVNISARLGSANAKLESSASKLLRTMGGTSTAEGKKFVSALNSMMMAQNALIRASAAGERAGTRVLSSMTPAARTQAQALAAAVQAAQTSYAQLQQIAANIQATMAGIQGGGAGGIAAGVAGAAGGGAAGGGGGLGGILGQIFGGGGAGGAGGIITAVAGAINPVAGVIAGAITLIGGAVTSKVKGIFDGIRTAINNTTESLKNFLGWVLRISAGQIVADVLRDIGRALLAIPEAAGAAATQFQALRIQFDTIAARDYARQFGGSVIDALGKVTAKSRELLGWVRKISLSTPFTVENLANTVVMAQSYGFTTEQAKRLTLAVGNFTAGMGLGNEQLTRIVYNMGQMMAAGRTTGRELRDLANNFVPVNDIAREMAKNMGISIGEMRQRMKEGRISAREFSEAFLIMAERDFPGAMERMSKTMQGVINNISDFVHVAFGWYALGPLWDNLAGKLNDFLQRLMQPDIMRYFVAAGLALNMMFEVLWKTITDEVIPALGSMFTAFGMGGPSMEGLVKGILNIGFAIRFVALLLGKFAEILAGFFTSFAEAYGKTFGEMMVNIFKWGANLGIQLAKGLMSVASFIIKAVTFIANIISSLLKPGSDPKALPHISDYGAAAAMRYVSGLQDANVKPAINKFGEKVSAAVSKIASSISAPELDFGTWGDKSIMGIMKGWKPGDFSIFKDVSSVIKSYFDSLQGIGRMGEGDVIPNLVAARKQIAELINTVRRTGVSANLSIPGELSPSINTYLQYLLKSEAASKQYAEAEKLINNGEEILQGTLLGSIKVWNTDVDSVEDVIEVLKKFADSYRKPVTDYIDALIKMRDANRLVEESEKQLTETTEYYEKKLSDLNAALRKNEDAQEDLTRIKEIDRTLRKVILTVDERERLELEKRGILLKRQIEQTELDKKVAVDAAQDKLKIAQEAAKKAEDYANAQKKYTLDIMKAQVEAAEQEVAAQKSLLEIGIENNELLAAQLELIKKLKDKASELGDEDIYWDFGEADIEGLDALTAEIPNIQKTIEGLMTEVQTKWDTLMKDFEPKLEQLGKDFAELGKTLGLFAKNAETNFSSTGTSFDNMIKIIQDPVKLKKVGSNISSLLREGIEDYFKVMGGMLVGTFFTLVGNPFEVQVSDDATKRGFNIGQAVGKGIQDYFKTLGEILKSVFLTLVTVPFSASGTSQMESAGTNFGTKLGEAIKYAFNPIQLAVDMGKKIGDFLAGIFTPEFFGKVGKYGEDTISKLFEGFKAALSGSAARIFWDAFRALIKSLLHIDIGNPPTPPNPPGGGGGGGGKGGWKPEALGGSVYPGFPVLVGERGPEIFMPKYPGYIYPNTALSIPGTTLPRSQITNVYNRTVTVNMNANYSSYQSPASVGYDISAALIASRL